MIDAIKSITLFLAVVAVPTLLLLFRKDIRTLIAWVVSFRRIEKTKDGFAISPDGGAEPPGPPIVAKESLMIAAIRDDDHALAGEVSSATEGETDSWWKASGEKRHEDAIRLLEEEFDEETDPERRITLRGVIGNEYFSMSPEKGIAYFERLLVDNPTSATAYDWYALTFLWKDLVEKCLAVISRGLPFVSDKGMLLETKVVALMKLERLDEAYAAALDGVRQSPENIQNYRHLSAIETRRHNIDQARVWYLRALVASNNADGVLAAYAEWLADHGFQDEALLRYQMLMTRHPENATYRALAGNAYLANGSADRALQAYLKADELAEGKQGWILGNIGNVYKNAKLYALAEEYLRRAATLDVSSEYAHEKLAATLKEKAAEDRRIEKLLSDASVKAFSPTPEIEAAVRQANPKQQLGAGSDSLSPIEGKVLLEEPG